MLVYYLAVNAIDKGGPYIEVIPTVEMFDGCTETAILIMQE